MKKLWGALLLILFFSFRSGAIVGKLDLSDSERAAIQSHTVAVINTENPDSHSRCTGTLIGPHTVLTAAHCIETDVSNLFVVTSIYEFAVLERKVVVSATAHPNYKSFDIPKLNQPNYDVAVIQFAGNLDSNYQPTSWMPSYTAAIDRYWLYVAGYGISADNADDSGELRFSKVTIENALFNAQQSFMTGNQRNGEGICKGDSGGPAYIKIEDQFYILGIVSAITGGCNGTSYFNKTDFYNDWIQSQIP